VLRPTHLLDTAILIWAVEEPGRLSSAAVQVCSRADYRPVVSVISLMELVVKQATGKIRLEPDPVQWWNRYVPQLGYGILPLRQVHVETLWELPLLHRDPADRLLISQALAEGIPLASSDGTIAELRGRGDLVIHARRASGLSYCNRSLCKPGGRPLSAIRNRKARGYLTWV
jgi:PIN domain nuclease of toxin-antitoxin system